MLIIPSALPTQMDHHPVVLILQLFPLAHAMLSPVQQSGSIADQVGPGHNNNNEQLTVEGKIY